MSRRALTAALFPALAAVAVLGAAEPTVSETWGFKATFPYPVQEKPSDSGTMFTASDPGDSFAYMLSIYTLPGKVLAERSPKEILDSAVQGAGNGDGRRLVSTKDITVQGVAGREFQVAGPGHSATCRVFLAKGRMYLVMAVITEGKVPTVAPETFLGSFSLLK